MAVNVEAWLARWSGSLPLAAIGCACIVTSGCAVVPNDGPSRQTIVEGGQARNGASLVLVNLDFNSAQAANGTLSAALGPGLASVNSNVRTDLIQPGDVIAVSIFEPNGASLFQVDSGGSSISPIGTSQASFPRLVVDPDGAVDVPFAGSVPVANLTPQAAARAIERSLHGRTASPQVIVNVLNSNANSVSVIGEVRNVGRFPLSAHSDRLLDVIAAAGGPTKPYQDIEVQIIRDGELPQSAPMADLMIASDQNIRLAPGDQVRLLLKARKYSVFGAFGRVTQTDIVDDRVTLADAISRAGGLDTWSADNAAVFVFRFENPNTLQNINHRNFDKTAKIPTVYMLDMKKDPAALLVADSFNIKDGDLIYVPRASIVSVTKFMQTVNAIAQAGYSVKVTGAP